MPLRVWLFSLLLRRRDIDTAVRVSIVRLIRCLHHESYGSTLPLRF